MLLLFGEPKRLLASLLFLATSWPAAPKERASYVDLVRDYAKAPNRPAVEELLKRSRRDIRRSAREVRNRSELVWLAPGASLLHAEAAFASPMTEAFHLDEAKAYLALLGGHPDSRSFERDWCLLVGDFYTNQLRVGRAAPYLDRAVELDRDAVSPRLARAVSRALGGWLGNDERELSEAAALLDELAGETSIAVEVSVRRAHVELLRGRTRRAIELLESSVADTGDPGLMAVAQALLGKAYTERGRLDDAVRAYGRSLAADPHLQNAAIGASKTHLERGEMQEARRVLTDFLEHAGDDDPLDGWWTFILGEAAGFENEVAAMRRRVTQ